jgi:hypothetical protein
MPTKRVRDTPQRLVVRVVGSDVAFVLLALLAEWPLMRRRSSPSTCRSGLVGRVTLDVLERLVSRR